MKLVRWLLSNILLIVFVLVLSYLYVYWDNLTDKNTPAGEAIAWLSEGFWFKAEREKLPGQQLAETGETSRDTSAEADAPENIPPADMTDQSATMTVKKDVAASVESPVKPAPAEETAMQQSETVPSGDTKPMSTRERWVAARMSYHLGDYENSIRHYQKLIATTQYNYEAYGELGNVYFSRGDIKQAAAAYYESAAILVRLGQPDRASGLMELLEKIDAAKARELQQLIASVSS